MRALHAFGIFAVGSALTLASANASPLPLQYEAHVAHKGWLSPVVMPSTAGSTGQARQMEALQIEPGVFTDAIFYRAHVAGIGWLPWVGPGYQAGTTGQGRQLEAVQVRVAQGFGSTHKAQCRAHVAELGWLPWVGNGQTCGTTGEGRRAEAVQIRLIPVE